MRLINPGKNAIYQFFGDIPTPIRCPLVYLLFEHSVNKPYNQKIPNTMCYQNQEINVKEPTTIGNLWSFRQTFLVT